MSNHHNACTISFFVIAAVFPCIISNHAVLSSSVDSWLLLNDSFVQGFSPAVATWYDDPIGAGSGGACGFDRDVDLPQFNGFTAAGNQNLFKSGKGCGSCYQVKCKENVLCSGNPIKVTITNECPGACNDDPIHFDLSGKAFGGLAHPGQADNLRQFGRINIQYERVACDYQTSVAFKIDQGSNPYYMAFAVEFVSGDGDIGSMYLFPSNSQPINMQQVYGATYKADIPSGVTGPYSIKLSTIESGQIIFAHNVIPPNWAPGQRYSSL